MNLKTTHGLFGACAFALIAHSAFAADAAVPAAAAAPGAVPPAPVAPGDLPPNPLIKPPKITLNPKITEQPPMVGDLIGAIRADDCPGLAKMLKTGINPNQYDAFGYTPLTVAALDKHVECIKSLLDAGADVNIASSGGWTPLIGAAMSGASGAVMTPLIEKGADLNAQNQWGCTALYYAAGFGALGTVNFLIDKGAKYPGTGPDCPTPLKIAQLRGYPELIKRFEMLDAAGGKSGAATKVDAAKPADAGKK